MITHTTIVDSTETILMLLTIPERIGQILIRPYIILLSVTKVDIVALLTGILILKEELEAVGTEMNLFLRIGKKDENIRIPV